MKLHELVTRFAGVKKSVKGFMVLCPAHDDKTPSLSISEGKSGQILLKCFAGCSTDTIVNAIGIQMKDLFLDSNPSSATAALRYRRPVRFNGHGSASAEFHAGATKKRIDAVYPYADAHGNVLYENVRFQGKEFRQRRPDGDGGYLFNLEGVKRVPYRLPELLDARKSGVNDIWFTEGEKDADNLRLLGFAATSFKNWNEAFNQYIEGTRGILFADHDASGVKQVNDAAKMIGTSAASVRIIDLFDGEPERGQDVSDWIAICRSEGLDCDEIAQRLSTRVKMADQGLHRALPPVPKIDAAALFDDIERYVGRFVSYPSEDAMIAHVLWIAHTWLMRHWDSTPRLAVLSPEPGSGKSRLLEVTEPLVPRPVHAVNTTPNYLFRKVSDPEGPPTILYDEIDTVFGPRAKENEEIRGMLNAGHRKGAVAGRCITRGRTVETEEFPAYCAVALAGLNDLPDTIMTRSVVIRMRRRAPNEQIEPWRQRTNGAEGRELASRLAIWAESITAVSFPDPPVGIEDRNADIWEPLLTVAELAGGKWPELSRKAAVALVASAEDRPRSLGIQLLADLRTIFGGETNLATATIVERLMGLPESTWSDLRGKPLDSRSLSKLLSPYGAKPKQFRDGNRNTRGYERSELEDAWRRYLSN